MIYEKATTNNTYRSVFHKLTVMKISSPQRLVLQCRPKNSHLSCRRLVVQSVTTTDDNNFYNGY
jgi:hypothetical protein